MLALATIGATSEAVPRQVAPRRLGLANCLWQVSVLAGSVLLLGVYAGRIPSSALIFALLAACLVQAALAAKFQNRNFRAI